MNKNSLSRLREKHPRWKGYRRIDVNGYVIVWTKDRAVHEHRLIMENSIGRKLKKAEIVHHKNGNRSDNRIENLELTNRTVHAIIHHTGNKYNKGRKHSKEVIINETRHLIGNKYALGLKHTIETKKKMSESHKKINKQKYA